MAFLKLILEGPFMSCGTSTVYFDRPTDYFPSLSQITGFLGACLGRKRGDSVQDLASLTYYVCEAARPAIHHDYQLITVKKTFEDDAGYHKPIVKSYLAESSFVVLVESEDIPMLEALLEALKHPVFQPYIGRKACPPAFPYFENTIYDGPLEDVLKQESRWIQRLYTTREDLPEDQILQRYIRNDLPVTTDRFYRTYAQHYWQEIPVPVQAEEGK